MKKVTSFIFLLIGFYASSQKDFGKSPTSISPLLISERVSNITIQTIDGKDTPLYTITKVKKTILVVYRGGWCPYCNLHLSAIGEAEAQLLAMGYQIVAVSPDTVTAIQETITKDKLNYTLLSDSKGDLIKSLGIGYTTKNGVKKKVKTLLHGVKNDFLPVPSLFILNEDNDILFEYISPDYKNRISLELLLAVAHTLK
jgi:peroxiredoxin